MVNCGFCRNEELPGVASPEDVKYTNEKSNVDSHCVEDLNMVQCNGARRSINLKSLSPPHNLRTRARTETGHLLRSKASPRHEQDNNKSGDKFFEKYEGYTIKKRAKGTIWLEEDDPGDKARRDKEEFSEDESKDKILRPLNHASVDGKGKEDLNCSQANGETYDDKCNGIDAQAKEGHERCKSNGYSNDENKDCEVVKLCLGSDNEVEEITCNGDEHERDTRGRLTRVRSCRGGARKLIRGKHRLSVEERLIEDNRAYYKVEVLGNKLRSSVPLTTPVAAKVVPEVKKEDETNEQSSEKPVVVRFKRVRQSELSLLSDEAENFMFGDARRDSQESTDDSSADESVLPGDTESSGNRRSSSLLLTSPNKENSKFNEDDSRDSLLCGRIRKRRRTQAEALMNDNENYYKFQSPGSRLRYQAPLLGIKDENDRDGPLDRLHGRHDLVCPSRPSDEVEKMTFSFEVVPRSEPWYQTYQRQDEGAEYWYNLSEGDRDRPFLLPYEISNFHEILAKTLNRGDKRKPRGRRAAMGRSPRKSPRCHASTLAIMSTIIRKREQQRTLPTVHEEDNKSDARQASRSQSNTPKPEVVVQKSEPDEELREIAKNIENMLNECDKEDPDESFELNLKDNSAPEEGLLQGSSVKGAPQNLLELLENCHEFYNCRLENSSCASSECGEASVESPLKRRKKRKNKTGWPGKIRRRLQNRSQMDEAEKAEGGEPGAGESLDREIASRLSGKESSSCLSIKGSSSSYETATSSESQEDLPDESESCLNDENVNRRRSTQNVNLQSRKRRRPVTSSSARSSQSEGDKIFKRNIKRHSGSSMARKRLRKSNSTSSIFHRRRSAGTLSRKRKRTSTLSPADVDNCKKNLFRSVSPRKQRLQNAKRRRVTAAPSDNNKDSSDLYERVVSQSEIDSKRASIDYQPVVRVMKIEDQVDHGVLTGSVTVVSNRRLRSSSSPMSSNSRASRFRSSRGQNYKRWLKHS